ncbi:hypothetical protein C8J56DRAFT_550500 [Mycena floridula]|nr:hypothetical protein C8J56DRAFT_550500 [Mycena floridula]
MTVRFANYRMFFFAIVFLLSAAVIGISAYFAAIFLPTYPSDFTIFSLVVGALTIFVFLLLFVEAWSQPRLEAIALFILGVLWLTMGAWSTDILGSGQCDVMTGQTPTKHGHISTKQLCYERRVVQAFSWMLTALFSIALTILISLVGQAQRLGRPAIWYEPIRELGWFGEWPGYYNTHSMVMYPNYYPAQQAMMPATMAQVPMAV